MEALSCGSVSQPLCEATEGNGLDYPVGGINPMQYERILKRREERLRREAIRPNQPRQKYLHESRHKHAISRVRGKKGRFVNQNDDTPAHRRPSDSSDSAPAMLANPVYRQPAPTPQPVAIYR